MELKDKAKWHVDLNGGLVPFLEMPDGKIVLESKGVMDYAEELGGDDGYRLYSKDPKVKVK